MIQGGPVRSEDESLRKSTRRQHRSVQTDLPGDAGDEPEHLPTYH